MKFIARHLNLIGLLMLAAFGAAAAGLYFETPGRAQSAKAKEPAPTEAFVCPMHPNVTGVTPAACPECGMKLVAIGSNNLEASAPHKGGCCAEKPVAAEPPPAATCPHLAAQAAPAPSCCPKPVNP